MHATLPTWTSEGKLGCQSFSFYLVRERVSLSSSVVLYTRLTAHGLPGIFLSLFPIWPWEPWDYRLVLPVQVYIGLGIQIHIPGLHAKYLPIDPSLRLPRTLLSDLIVLPQHPEPHRSELVLLVIEFQPPVRNSGKLVQQWETFLKHAELWLTGS